MVIEIFCKYLTIYSCGNLIILLDYNLEFVGKTNDDAEYNRYHI
jgi:hypothetical protein